MTGSPGGRARIFPLHDEAMHPGIRAGLISCGADLPIRLIRDSRAVPARYHEMRPDLFVPVKKLGQRTAPSSAVRISRANTRQCLAALFAGEALVACQ